LPIRTPVGEAHRGWRRTEPVRLLKDRFGLSWQIIPTTLGRMPNDKDAAKASRVMNAMLQMEKLDLKRLQQAYKGE
jgi:predicted 3-demethylubiquinone-9 3-methyltransferase (glyoxalase superfamily)